MKFLITGGAGFIGTALANALVRAGNLVRALDDLSSGDPTRLNQAAHFTRGDVADVPKLWSLLQGVDCVYHLAARVSVPESVLYPRDYNATCWPHPVPCTANSWRNRCARTACLTRRRHTP